MRVFRAALAVLCALSTAGAFAAPLSIEALLQAVESERASRPDDLQLQFTHAMALGQLGRFNEAADLFRRMLSRDPSLLRPRLELALVLFKAGDLDGARYHFEQVLAHSLPDAVRQNVNAMLERIREARSYFSASFDVVVDSNPRQATTAETVEIDGVRYVLRDDSRAKKSTGIQVTLDGRLPLPFSESTFAHGRVEHIEHSGRLSDLSYIQTGIGRNLTGERGTTTMEVGAHHAQYQLRGLYSGVTFSLSDQRRWRDSEWSVIQIASQQLKYSEYAYRDGWQHSGTARLIHIPSPQARWEFDLGHIRTTARESAYAFDLNHVGVRRVHEFEGGWIFGVRLRFAEAEYDGTDPFFRKVRKDSEKQAEIQLSNRKIRFWRLTPQVQIGITRHRSNIDFFEFDRSYVRVGMHGSF